MHVTAVIRGGAGVQKANVCDYQAVSYKCISSSDSGQYHCPYRHSSSLQQADRAARSRSNLHYTAGYLAQAWEHTQGWQGASSTDSKSQYAAGTMRG